MEATLLDLKKLALIIIVIHQNKIILLDIESVQKSKVVSQALKQVDSLSFKESLLHPNQVASKRHKIFQAV